MDCHYYEYYYLVQTHLLFLTLMKSGITMQTT